MSDSKSSSTSISTRQSMRCFQVEGDLDSLAPRGKPVVNIDYDDTLLLPPMICPDCKQLWSAWPLAIKYRSLVSEEMKNRIAAVTKYCRGKAWRLRSMIDKLVVEDDEAIAAELSDKFLFETRLNPSEFHEIIDPIANELGILSQDLRPWSRISDLVISKPIETDFPDVITCIVDNATVIVKRNVMERVPELASSQIASIFCKGAFDNLLVWDDFVELSVGTAIGVRLSEEESYVSCETCGFEERKKLPSVLEIEDSEAMRHSFFRLSGSNVVYVTEALYERFIGLNVSGLSLHLG
jgi:hypothetical protein